MKHLKFLFFALLSISIISCGDDGAELSNDNPAVTFDVTAVIALAPGSDITNLVTFNGQTSATYTSELTLSESLIVGRPEGLNVNDEFVYSEIVVFKDVNGEFVEMDFDEVNFTSNDGNLQFVIPAGQPSNYFDLLEVEVFEIRAINSETEDVDYKYDIEVYITRDGTEYGPYYIDPKIRIKSLN